MDKYFLIATAVLVGLLVYFWESLLNRRREKKHLDIQQKRVETFKGINFLGASQVKPRLVDTLFTCFYGIKIQLDPNNEEELEACASGSDERCKKARDIGLETYCDRLTDGEDYFIYIGTKIGSLNFESCGHASIETDELNRVIQDTNKRLCQVFTDEAPSLHLQSSHEY